MTITESEYRKRRRITFKNAGLCTICGQSRDRNGLRCTSCNNKQLEFSRFYRSDKLQPRTHFMLSLIGKNIDTTQIINALENAGFKISRLTLYKFGKNQ